MAVLGVLLAAAGLYILAGNPAAGWNRGDFLVLICAIWISLHILMTGYYAPELDTLALATWQIGCVAMLSLASSSVLETISLSLPRSVWAAVGVTAVLATVFAFAVQTYAQRYTPPTRAALIFTGEPVFGALFAHFYGGEPFLKQHLVGGGLIFLGMILAEIRPTTWGRASSQSKSIGNKINHLR
jgi:drug/metabolite transporter (DMT)-like permease